MVVIHIANIDKAILGGVQVAVPQMIRAQASHATVGCINTHGDVLDGVQMLTYEGGLDLSKLPPPFHRPDLVVFHEVYRPEFIAMYKVLRKAGVPYVVLPHGSLSRQAQKRKRLKKLAANLLLFRRFLRCAKAIQYLSENEAQLSAFPQYPFFVRGNGIVPPAVKKETFFQNGVRFLYVGRLEIITKGLDLLLAAIKACAKEMRSAKAALLICGPQYQGEHEALKALVDRYGIADLVSIRGAAVGEEKQQLLLGADCFIQSSRTEGLPMGPLEALGYGLPCIATKGATLGGVIEAYGAGFSAETSAEGIKEALLRFLASRNKILEMSRAAVRLVDEHYDTDRIAAKTVEKYGDIALK